MSTEHAVITVGAVAWMEARVSDDRQLLDLPKLDHDLPALAVLLAECERWQACPDLAAAAALLGRIEEHLIPYTVPGFARRRRIALLERDGRRCYLCGRPLSNKTGTIDHVLPLAHGGEDRGANMRAACKPCNTLKGGLTVGEFHERHHARVIISEGLPHEQ